MSEQRPWLWTWWQWQSGSQADAAPGWSLNLVEQSEGEDEPEDTVFHTLAIGAPGGVSVDLGRVSRHPKLERGFASRPPNYTWWMHTNYGTWEVCYRDPEPYGHLELCVYASKHGGDWAAVTLRKVPSALIAELSDCLELPPEAWPLRPGWQQKGPTARIPQAVVREHHSPVAAAATPPVEAGRPPHGIGAYTCKEILDQLVPAIEQKDKRTVNEISIAMTQWTVGYGFGIQLTRGRDIDVLEGMDEKSMGMMLLDSCLAHPDLKLGQVVTNWMVERAQALAKQKGAR